MAKSDLRMRVRFQNFAISCSLFGILLLPGCTSQTFGPKLMATTQPVSDPLNWSDWALTLSTAVEGDQVNYQKLLSHREPLIRFLNLLATSGPQRTPKYFTTRDMKLAYFINAHNAAVVSGILDLARKGRIPTSLPSGFDSAHAIRVDGRSMSIAALRNQVFALGGDDWRVALTLYQGSVTGPDLDRHMILPDMIDARLNQTARAMLASRGVVRIDHGEGKRILLWPPIYRAREALIKGYNRGVPPHDVTLVSALLTWSDPDQRFYLNSAIGYDVAPMPDDRTIDAVIMTQK